MNFNFEIEEKILRRKKPKRNLHEDFENLFCSFVFTTPEWKHIDKYAIFWNRKGKSTIRYLGKNMRTKCPLPEMVLNDLHFFVQVYANDEVFTQKLKVYELKQVPVDREKECRCKRDICKFVEKINDKIDNVVLENGELKFYSENTLVKVIEIVDDNLISRILTDIAPKLIVDTALSPNSELPVSSRLVYEALKTKVTIGSLSSVALTGSYSDLTDIPTEFNPSPHTHTKDDIEDFDASVDEDLDTFVEDLIIELHGD